MRKPPAAGYIWPTATTARPGGHEGRKVFTMEKYKIHLNYLDVYAKQLSQLENELLDRLYKYDVTADLDQVERLSSQLEKLKTVLDTFQPTRAEGTHI